MMPLSWERSTGFTLPQFKMLVDRLYSFNSKSGNRHPPSARRLKRISRGDPEPPALFPQFYDHLNEWLNLIPLTLGAGNYEFLHQYGADIDRKAALNDPALIEKARQAGKKLLV